MVAFATAPGKCLKIQVSKFQGFKVSRCEESKDFAITKGQLHWYLYGRKGLLAGHPARYSGVEYNRKTV